MNKLKSYDVAIGYLENLEKRGVDFSLSRTLALCHYFGDPQDKIKVIHVTGTNGKGSVCAFTARILEEAGFCVGLYTSPHLVDVRERICINQQCISKKEFLLLFNEVRQAIKKTGQALTYFEFLTLLAFLYFARKKVDFVVLEVGMGGRLDATNVVPKPLACVITNVGLEHTDYLGKTLAAIAKEKAAIIKDKTYVIMGTREPQVVRIVKKMCVKKEAVLWLVGKDVPMVEYKLGLAGEHQRSNAACAIGVMRALQKQGIKITEKAIAAGLRNTVWPGRLEFVRLHTANCHERTVLLDGAHNPPGAKELVHYLSSTKKYKKLVLVFSILKDKDYNKVIEILAGEVEQVALATLGIDRACSPVELEQVWRKYLPEESVKIFPNPKEALRHALAKTEVSDLVCVTGSLYLVGEIKKLSAVSVTR